MSKSRDRDREEVVARLQVMRRELESMRSHFELGVDKIVAMDEKLQYLVDCLERDREATEREKDIIQLAREEFSK